MLKQLLRSLLGWARFARLLAKSAIPAAQKATVFLSVSAGGTGSAADLRGHAVARALPRYGFHAVTLHASLSAWQRKVLLKAYSPEVIVLQQTRNPCNTPALYPGLPCILDVDDADIIDPAARERIGNIARHCQVVVAGSRYLASLFSQYNKNTAVIWTGTYRTEAPNARANVSRARIVAWAPSDPFGYPDEADFVLETIRLLSNIEPFEFRIYGIAQNKREQALARCARQLPSNITLELVPPMPYEPYIASLAEVAVGLQPVCESNAYSLGKSFGKVLAYLAADVAVIASDNIDHPLFFHDGRNGLLPAHSPQDWASACSRLLASPQDRQSLVSAARKDFLSRLTTEKATALLSEKLREAINTTHSHA